MCFAAFALLPALGVAQSTDYYVSTSGSNTTGLSWATAFNDVQSALSSASSGDRIFVAAGTYNPTQLYDISAETTSTSDPRRAVFRVPDGVELYGGLAGTETGTIDQAVLDARDFSTNETILSGDFDNDDLVSGSSTTLTITNNTENAYHIFFFKNSSSATVVDGFTITGGNANQGTNFDSFGGAFVMNGTGFGNPASPTLRNCIITANVAQDNGGAVYLMGDGTAPSFTNCTFSKNENTSNSGGAIFDDGGQSSFTDCEFSGNNTTGSGGAIYTRGNNLSFTNCIFSENAATSDGGAVYSIGALDGISNSTFVNCSFSGNAASDDGGAMYNYGDGGQATPTLTNCTFSGNHASDQGGAILSDARDQVVDFGVFVQTFVGSSNPNIENGIFWGNTATNGGLSWVNSRKANTRAAYTLIEEASLPAGSTDNGNNITGAADPFNNAANGDLTLAAGSPAIDAGDNGAVPSGVTTDANGNQRIQDGGNGNIVDMGAFEFMPAMPAVSLALSTSSTAEDNGQSLTFTFTRDMVSSSSLTVNFSASGTATYNDDYFLIGGSSDFNGNTGTVVIPANQGSTALVFQIQPDAIIEPNETIVVTVEP